MLVTDKYVISFPQFVAAGEHIVHHCPTWQWAMGEEAKVKPYLPKEKQYLITRNGKLIQANSITFGKNDIYKQNFQYYHVLWTKSVRHEATARTIEYIIHHETCQSSDVFQ